MLVCTDEVYPPNLYCLILIQLLGISAIVLANLCVSYIMTSHTEEVNAIWVTKVMAHAGVHDITCTNNLKKTFSLYIIPFTS